MMRRACLQVGLGLMLLLMACATMAQPFGYVGVLSDSSGPVANGNYDIRVRLFDAASNGGELAAADEHLLVAVQGGNFAIELDFGAAILAAPDAWLQLEVRASGMPSYDVQSPRQRITGAPLALFAEHAALVDWMGIENVPAGFADGNDNDSLAAISCGNGALLSFDSGSGSWQCGAPGADGNGVLSGVGAPAPALGSPGDFYINTAVPAIYGPKIGSNWGAATALQGPSGNPGPQGPPGQDAGVVPYPPAIGSIVFAGTGIDGSPPTPGVVVHSFELEFNREYDPQGGGSGLSNVQFSEVQLLVDPGAALPQLFGVTASGNNVTSATLSAGTGPHAISIVLDNLVLNSLQLETSTTSGQADLARLRLEFSEYSLSYGGQSSGFDRLLGSVTVAPSPLSVCNNLFAPMALSTPLSNDPALGLPVIAATAPLDLMRMPGAGPGGSRIRFEAPSFSTTTAIELEPDNRLVFACASHFALDGTPLANTRLNRHLAGNMTPVQWTEWGTVHITGYAVRSLPDGTLEAGWSFTPINTIRVSDDNGNSCWNVDTNASC